MPDYSRHCDRVAFNVIVIKRNRRILALHSDHSRARKVLPRETPSEAGVRDIMHRGTPWEKHQRRGNVPEPSSRCHFDFQVGSRLNNTLHFARHTRYCFPNNGL